MAPRSWLSSWALKRTVRPSRGESRRTRSTTTCCWCGSRLISGSSRRRRRGPADERLGDEQALALAAGHPRQRPSARVPVPPTMSSASSTGAPVGGRDRGRPQRSPLTARGDEVAAGDAARSAARSASAAGSRSPACRGGRARRRRRSARSRGGTRPRIARISVVLPEPFGPSTPTNSPSPTSKPTSARIGTPPSDRVTWSKAMALKRRAPRALCRRVELVEHPADIGLALGHRLGDADDRDAGLLRRRRAAARSADRRPGCCRRAPSPGRSGGRPRLPRWRAPRARSRS